MSKRTVVIGASTNPSRYSYSACQMLNQYNHDFVPVSIKKGSILNKEILNIKDHPMIDKVDTITLYLSPQNQTEYYEYLLSLNPKRIIFNPGTENQELAKKAKEKGVETEFACTLVLLSTGQY